MKYYEGEWRIRDKKLVKVAASKEQQNTPNIKLAPRGAVKSLLQMDAEIKRYQIKRGIYRD